jgi:phenylpropionate dioxygenase-like ring-hydroxylating dioxygenase large terminal subunit
VPFDNKEELDLIGVGPGTPSGEVFRRYWLPVECSANLGGGSPRDFAGSRNPIPVRMLGEDLVLFRDGSGQAGLLAEHCSHRGTSLLYGRVEDNCLRCLYHGWAYNRAGNVIDTPAEPPGSMLKSTVKHKAYPVVEAGGLIFGYMGPPEMEPLFPRYPQLFRKDGVRVTGNGGYVERCSVFQALHDNNLDPWHGEIAHGWFRGRPPVAGMYYGPDGQLATPWKADRTPWGTRYAAIQGTSREGVFQYHETHTVWPCQRFIFRGGRSIKWAVPLDDFHTRWFGVDFFPFDENGEPPVEATRHAGNKFHVGYVENLPKDWMEQVGAWWNLGHPWRQGNLWEDEVCQSTQGPEENNRLPNWENWHLATSDKGLLVNREVWREQIDRVQEGLDPIGVVRAGDPEHMIWTTADDIGGLSYEEARRLYNMTVDERMAMVDADAAAGHI